MQESVVPELIQAACNPDAIAYALAESLQETSAQRTRTLLQKVSDALSHPDKTVRIEALVQKLLAQHTWQSLLVNWSLKGLLLAQAILCTSYASTSFLA